MTTVTETTASTATTQTTQSSAEKSTATAASDFDSFLSLLTAQLKNQDPLAPLEATQFVEQLASFSSVEQQIETNRLLEELLSGSQDSGLETATAWIGKEVEANVSSVRFEGEPLSFSIPTSDKGTATQVTVRNSSNEVIYTESISAGQTSFSWDGKLSDGGTAPSGEYTIAADYAKDGTATDSLGLLAVSRVVEARLADDGFELVLENGATVDPASVSAVRETASDT